MPKFDTTGLPEEAASYIAQLEEANEGFAAELAKSDSDKDTALADALDRVATLESEVDTLRKSATTEGDDEDQVEELLKSANPALAQHVAALKAQADEATTIAKAERDERLNREFISKAEQLDAISVDASAFGPILKSAAEKLTAEEFTALSEVLNSANEIAKSGALFKEAGSAGQVDPASAEAKIEKAAEELRKSDSTLTPAQAKVKVLEDNPELYAEYRSEQKGN